MAPSYGKETECIVIDFYEALLKAERRTGRNLYADGVHPNAEATPSWLELC